jgi:hypothetical protein
MRGCSTKSEKVSNNCKEGKNYIVYDLAKEKAAFSADKYGKSILLLFKKEIYTLL